MMELKLTDKQREVLARVAEYLGDIHDMSESDDSAQEHGMEISHSAYTAHKLLMEMLNENR